MARGWNGAVFAAAAVLLSGCIEVGPDYSPPTLAVADAWLQSSDSVIERGAVDQAWWTVFDDGVLNGLIERA